MEQIRRDVEDYFASLSTISKKILSDQRNLKDSYGDEWNQFSQEDKDDLVDKFIVDPAVADKHKQAEEEDLPEIFPKLKINCGEKIVVDFENDDGWTWRDEHSGPFSWASRSQQDLTLVGLEEEPSDDKTSKKPVRPPRRHRSPDPKGDNSKASWNAGQEMTAADEIFLKFGIQFGADKDEDIASGPASPAINVSEESKLLASPTNNPRTSPPPSRESSVELQEAASGTVPCSSDGMDSESPKRRSFGMAKNRDSGKWRTSVTSTEAEQSLINDLTVDVEPTSNEVEDPGQISPVFLEDVGESSTDHEIIEPTTPEPEPYVIEEIEEIHESTTSTIPPEEDGLENFNIDSALATSTNSLGQKTGFDFLDNW